MDFITVLLTGIGLSMDAAAVSIAKGMSLKNESIKEYAFKLAFFFGLFQAGMPLIGYFAGSHFAAYIQALDHWIAFILLGFIGFNMIKESREEKEEEEVITSISYKDILVLAIATSIDALAVGVSYAFLNIDIVPVVICIGITTFTLSLIAVFAGKKLGTMFQKYAETFGGCILIFLGIKILVEHLFF